MPTNYTNRVVTILLCLWVSLSAIFPRVPGSLFWLFNPRGEVSFKHSLRPGIDMVGGTSLTYEIKQPEGGGGEKLAEQVATALKRRVDPNGVRNLVWRPQGADRLEIQMPLTRASAEGEALRKTYTQARDALDASNIPPVAVSNDIESLPAADREAKIREYAGQSEDRLKVLQEMATLADQIKSGREKRDFDAVARARLSYEALQDRLHATNVSIPALEQALQLTGTARDNALKPFRDRVANAPDRQDALSAFIKAYDEFASVRDRIDDAADLKRQLRGSGVLSFHILANPGIDTEFQQYVERLRTEGPRPQPGDRLKWFVVDRPQEFRGQAYEHNGKWYVLGHIDQGYSLMKGEGLPEWSLDRASADSDERGRPAVAFQFDAAGANYFGQLTQTFSPQGNRTYQLGIVLDDKLFSAPNINGPIGGRGIITGGEGGFSTVEQEYLVGTLNAGALPAQLNDEPISEITVGPQLGSDNLHAGLWSCAAGLVIVAIFMIGYYYLSGLVAFVAVVINLILILGVMALFKATFTLPGVAGVVLSVAMAVDANVLIFERLREEQARGLSLKMALRNSYDRAFSAILDGQVTTAISSAFLFLFGSEEVRGFGLTLLIGIITSLFTALYVTKTIFAIAVDKFGLRDLSSLPRRYPRWNQLMTPKVDWVGKSWIFVAFSIGFITLGLIAFGAKLNQRQALDIEFSGGTGVRVALKEGADMDRAQLQNLMEEVSQRRPNDLAAPRVVSVENDRRQYAITTTTTDTRAVQSAVIEGLGDRLDVKKPSRFTNVDADLAGAENQTVIPIESAATRIEGIPPSELASHIGGVAIVIDQLDPPLTKEQILDRIEARRYQEDASTRPENIEVETLGSNRAVVLVSDDRYAYNAPSPNAIPQWRSQLAGPAWNIVKDAINNPPQLDGVTSYTPQVAEEAWYNTVLAMTMSILGITAYIWLRFGNFKYGAATVVACAHDALFVLAAIGFSHYLGQIGFFENVLLIKPFRIDLTLVAAILTVIGYSMNDTVVVFDRVRENRGKFGVLSRTVINDSINQTFSRTILTGGTSLGILFVMYVIGGEGIHAFTFAMMLGIIVGTYSSIAVASPLLLYGNTGAEQARLAKTPKSQPVAG